MDYPLSFPTSLSVCSNSSRRYEAITFPDADTVCRKQAGSGANIGWPATHITPQMDALDKNRPDYAVIYLQHLRGERWVHKRFLCSSAGVRSIAWRDSERPQGRLPWSSTFPFHHTTFVTLRCTPMCFGYTIQCLLYSVDSSHPDAQQSNMKIRT